MTPQERLQSAMKYAFENRPAVDGFPFLAECLRKAGVEKNIWSLPSTQSIYVMNDGVVVQQGTPLVTGMTSVPVFNKDAFITALRADQASTTTFPQFLQASWDAGVVGYEVDFIKQTVTYKGARGEMYVESYK